MSANDQIARLFVLLDKLANVLGKAALARPLNGHVLFNVCRVHAQIDRDHVKISLLFRVNKKTIINIRFCYYIIIDLRR